MDTPLFDGKLVHSQRIIYTPSPFARASLVHLQEVGTLQARSPHASTRQGLASYLFFMVESGSGTLEYEGQTRALRAGDCAFLDCRRPYRHYTGDDLWTLRWVHFYGPNMGAIYKKYQQRGRVLQVGVHRGDVITPGGLQTGVNAGLLAKVAAERDIAHPIVLSVQFAGHTQRTVAGAVIHKDELKIRAVAGFHFRRHAGGFFIKKRHRFFFIVTGYDQTDEHGVDLLSSKYCIFYYSVVWRVCKQWMWRGS